MIEMLKDWVRDLVIIVIFANLLEMLLPDSSMRKYLKVVMGFFILLTVLNPLLTLLQADYQAFYPFNNLPGRKEQTTIQQNGRNLYEENQQVAIAAFQRQLAQQIRGLILTQAEIDDAEVQVVADANGKIESVVVQLKTAGVDELSDGPAETENRGKVGTDSNPNSSSKFAKTQIKPIQDVQIEISPQVQSRTREQGLGEQSKEMGKVQSKVIHLLTSFYNLQPEAIRFQ